MAAKKSDGGEEDAAGGEGEELDGVAVGALGGWGGGGGVVAALGAALRVGGGSEEKEARRRRVALRTPAGVGELFGVAVVRLEYGDPSASASLVVRMIGEGGEGRAWRLASGVDG